MPVESLIIIKIIIIESHFIYINISRAARNITHNRL